MKFPKPGQLYLYMYYDSINKQTQLKYPITMWLVVEIDDETIMIYKHNKLSKAVGEYVNAKAW